MLTYLNFSFMDINNNIININLINFRVKTNSND
jgi:hypothetical protein